jgi:hypothetical protein
MKVVSCMIIMLMIIAKMVQRHNKNLTQII